MKGPPAWKLYSTICAGRTASPQSCQQVYAANRDAELTAGRVSLSFCLLLSCLVVGEALWTIKRREYGLVLDKQTFSFTQLVGLAHC
jgi:hypothetical protein